MFNLEQLEQFRDVIESAEKYIWENPELGYKEYKTNEYLKKEFLKLGYTLKEAKDITGFTTTIDTGRKGKTFLILGELDSVICKNHPECDKETGAVHACGHNVQTAVLLGIATALKKTNALEGLSGKIKLCCVPAEEGCEINYRKQLIKEGKISYLTGKQEYIKRGFFDDVDLAMMVHVTKTDGNVLFKLGVGNNGNVKKITTFKGKASHAANPDEGINALNIASNAVSVINNLRETFKEKDHVRFHSIFTKAGDIVNVVPDTVVMESFVRGSNIQVIKETNKKINMAMAGVALAFGGNVEVEDLPGSMPLKDDPNLNGVAFNVIEENFGKGKAVYRPFGLGSTDMGDVSTIIPSIHLYVCCIEGACHGAEYKLSDKNAAFTENLKAQIAIIRKVLSNDCEIANEICEKFNPVFKTKQDYLNYMDSIFKKEELVEYTSKGAIIKA